MGECTYRVHVLHLRLLHVIVFLCNYTDGVVAAAVFLCQTNGFVAAHGDRNHHAGKQNGVP